MQHETVMRVMRVDPLDDSSDLDETDSQVGDFYNGYLKVKNTRVLYILRVLCTQNCLHLYMAEALEM